MAGSNTKLDKKRFYQEMQPYFHRNMVREIYQCDHFCILAVGERVYVACPFVLLDHMPYGLYMVPSVMRRIVEKNRKLYPIINEVFSDTKANGDLIFVFSKDRLDFWENWIRENSHVDKIDKALENELKNYE